MDLAGTNRANKTESTPEQLKVNMYQYSRKILLLLSLLYNQRVTVFFQEAQYINKSLNALGDVVSALSSDQPYIPYRNDKLTMLMQDSMGKNEFLNELV